MRKIIALSLLSILAAVEIKADSEPPLTCISYFKILDDGSNGGLSEVGLTVLKQQRDKVRSSFKELNSHLLHARSAIHAAFVARLLHGHMFIYGPQGGAKSQLARDFLAPERTFKQQLHQGMTEHSLIGGQNFEAAKLGEYVINTNGSLATFKTAILDEIDKGNPAVLTVLLGLMNEREVQIGQRVVKAELESLFATSNAILPEILESFRESGQLSTAAPLLNRFHFKAFLYNWLNEADQKYLSALKFKKLWEEALQFEQNEETLAQKAAAEAIDWEALRKISLYTIRFSDNALGAYTRLVNEMRAVTNHELDASRMRHAEDPDIEPFVYFPTADYSERLRQVIPEAVIHSVFLDFLLSPLADDVVLDRGFLNKPIELQPSSLWRSYLMMTTIFSGEAKLQNSKGKFAIEFVNEVDRSKLRDNRERALLKMIEKEQERFHTQYAKVANFECTKCESTAWLKTSDRSARIDLEELLQPNKKSDQLRKDAMLGYTPSREEIEQENLRKRNVEELRIAEEKRVEAERVAAAEKAKQERDQEEKRIAEEKRREEYRKEQERRAEEKRIAEQKRLEEEALLPPGDYKQSCRACNVDSADVLRCSCRARSGGHYQTKLDEASKCKDILNKNGVLTCKGSWYDFFTF